MKGIYNIRTLFEKYYSEYGNYIDAAAKFVTALILFMQINGRIGGKSIFGNIFVELVLALDASDAVHALGVGDELGP